MGSSLAISWQIQKALVDVIEPTEQPKINLIGRQRAAKNRGEAIQMPLLHITLVEVHREYAKVNMAAKAYKKATDLLQEQYEQSQAINGELLAKLQPAEEQLKQAIDRLNAHEGSSRLHENDQGLEEQLRDALKKLEETTNQVTQGTTSAEARRLLIHC